MPELPEVLLSALWLNDTLKGCEITNMKILTGRYSRHPLNGEELFRKYKPFKINEINSKGKFLWFDLTGKNDKSYYILNRFGLEGEWGFTKEKHSGLQFTIIDKDNIKSELYFTDSRNFGTVEIVNNKNRLNTELNKLGPDFLKTPFTEQEFYNRIEDYVTKKTNKIIKARGNQKIVTVLMNQTASGGLGSGLGNYLTAEILYYAEISPHTTMKQLYEDKKTAFILADSIKYITKLAFLEANVGYLAHLDPSMSTFIKKLRKNIDNNKNHENNYHSDTILDEKDTFTFQVYGKKYDPFKNPVKPDKIIPGRTTYWVPAIQK